jgi:hypothetical protein
VVPADGALLRADARPYEGRWLPSEITAKIFKHVGVRSHVSAKSYILFLGARSAILMSSEISVLVCTIVGEIIASDLG